MNQAERRDYLIRSLLAEHEEYREIQMPGTVTDRKRLLRSLMNVRPAAPISKGFEAVQDEYLQRENAARGVTKLADLTPLQPGLYLWQGDITCLQVDAIVNAANSGMTGCYRPCHACIDNCIHTYAGIQLRNYCADMMDALAEQNNGYYEEPTGQAKLTPAFNLPCKYVLHTVGPIVEGRLTKRHEALLASCYRSCLQVAEENGVQSIAFCCISTGVFMFPNRRAAEIAVQTVKEWKEETHSGMQVVFNVFKDSDRDIYQALLGNH